MAETRQIGRLTIHFVGDSAAELAGSFDGSLAGSQSFRDAMDETARTQKHIYIGRSIEDLRDQPGFDRANFNPDSERARNTSAFGRPSGADSYFIVVTNREHHLAQNNGQTFPGSMDLSLVHEFLHPSQIMRTLAESGRLETDESEARTQMREQKIAEELGKTPGKDFPDVFESGPYTVKLDSSRAQPTAAPAGDPVSPVDPTGYEVGTSPNLTQPISLRSFDDRSAPRLVGAPAGISNPNAAAPPPNSDGMIGLFSGKPMQFPFAPIFERRVSSGATSSPSRPSALDDLISSFGRSHASQIDAGAAAPVGSDRQTFTDDGNGAPALTASPVAFAPSIPTSPDPQAPLSLNEAYLEYLKRLNASQPQTLDTNAMSPSLAPSDDANFSGGLVGRLTALLGVDPESPDLHASPRNDPSDAIGDDLARRWSNRFA